MALYLQYRPQAFADVVGQDHIVTTLERAFAQNQLGHAYLFCGTRGTGKTSVARILAKTILTKGIEDKALLAGVIKGVEEGSFVDLIEIDAASNRRIDDVRDLIEKINFAPAVAKAKVYIIDEVHMLTKEAFNALLKTLEEPPAYAYFILATTELHKVPDTIQSRCQRFLFKKVKDEDVIRRLQYIADQERLTVDRDALRLIARHALGSFRDGISLLDQLRSLEKIALKDVTERVGASSAVFVEELMIAMEKKDTSAVLNIITRAEDGGVPLDVLADDLLGALRTSMHAAIEKKEDPGPYMHTISVILDALRAMRLSPVPVLPLETALLSLCGHTETITPAKPQPARAATPAAPIAKAAPKVESPAPAPVKAAEPDVKSALINAEDLTVATVFSHWEEILKRTEPPSARMSLKNASIQAIDEKGITLAFGSTFHRDRVLESKATHSIESALQDIFKRPIRIRGILDQSSTPVSGPSTDLAEAAEEVFGGM